jgi:hypothetical protein
MHPTKLPRAGAYFSSIIAVLTAIASFTTCGCSATSQPDYSKLGLVDITGTLTLDGTPLEGVEVRLETPEDLIYSYGVTDTKGKFRLMFDSRKPGIIPGKKRVIVVAKSLSEAEESSPGEEDGEEAKSDRTTNASNRTKASPVPQCYGRESKKFIDIDSSTKTISIELKSDCS